MNSKIVCFYFPIPWTPPSWIMRELKHARFETRTATGREHFASQDSGVPKSFILIISNREKILCDVNVVVWRQVKRENSSLPVAVRVSKTRVLNFRIVTSYGRPIITNQAFLCQRVHGKLNSIEGKLPVQPKVRQVYYFFLQVWGGGGW